MSGNTLTIHADRYTPVDAELIPTGAAAPVAGTRFDFRAGRRLTDGREGLIDHNFCLADARGPLRPACTLTAPDGLSLEMSTTEPGLQIFDGHSLELPEWPTQDGGHWQAYAAIAIEAQFWPDALNQPGFPSILLTPGAPWQQTTRWHFSRPA
jgi:aldose 1-epimerase